MWDEILDVRGRRGISERGKGENMEKRGGKKKTGKNGSRRGK